MFLCPQFSSHSQTSQPSVHKLLILDQETLLTLTDILFQPHQILQATFYYKLDPQRLQLYMHLLMLLLESIFQDILTSDYYHQLHFGFLFLIFESLEHFEILYTSDHHQEHPENTLLSHY